MNRHSVARLHHVHQAEVIERGAFLLEAGRQVHGEYLALKRFRFGAVALDGELKLPAALVRLRIIGERPGVASAIVLDRRGTKLARDEWRDKCPTTLVSAADEPDRQPRSLLLPVE